MGWDVMLGVPGPLGYTTFRLNWVRRRSLAPLFSSIRSGCENGVLRSSHMFVLASMCSSIVNESRFRPGCKATKSG